MNDRMIDSHCHCDVCISNSDRRGALRMSSVIYTPGVWDLLHIGHVRFLEKCAKLGHKLIVGVAGDQATYEDKGILPIINEVDRATMVKSLKCVTNVHIYRSLDFLHHLQLYKPQVLAVGDQWGSLQRHRDAEEWMKGRGRIVVIPRTEGISTTSIKHKIQGLLCHDSPAEDYESFCNGCDQYQRQMFGKCRTNELNTEINTLKRSLENERTRGSK